jgi:hypothetical protein
MNVEFYDPQDEQKLAVGSARWDGEQVIVTAKDPGVRDKLAHGFRRAPVATEDSARRRLGTHGTVVLEPGDLEWFRAAARTRVPRETGLVARFVPGGDVIGGYDPAANYRPFDEQIERIDARNRG